MRSSAPWRVRSTRSSATCGCRTSPGARCTPSSPARTRGWPKRSSSPPATRCAATRFSSSKRSAGPTCTSHSRWPSCAPPSAMPRNSRPEGGVRVLHVDSGREFRGGQNQVRLLTRELARDPTVEQRLVTQPGSELARRATAEGVTGPEVPWGLGLDPRAWWRLVVESLAWRPDLIHANNRSEEHTSELQSLAYLVCRLLLEKKKTP